MELKEIPLFLETSPRESNLRFQRVVNSCFAKNAALSSESSDKAYWNSSAFGLDQVRAFNELGASQQEAVTKRASEDLMREACFIEMAGLSYTARMSLEAKTLDERLFYSMMASEEATHFQLLRPFVDPAVLARGPDDFTGLIGEMITSADREHVIFLIQVLLEGWGLTHFSWMASNSQCEALRGVFKTILKDEARHHAAGVAASKGEINRNDKKIVEWLETILSSVAAGPVRLIRAIEDASGESVPRDEILNELDARTSTREKLSRLRTLLCGHVTDDVVAHLNDKRLFEPGF